MTRLALLLIAACAPPAPPASPRVGLPAEVTKLVERWETCWHFAGEEAYSAARKQEIADGIAAWCPGNDVERTRLQAKWQGDAAVQDALRKLDDMQ